MDRQTIIAKRARATRRAKRVRAKIHGTSERPRLTVFRSHKHISAQLIDDATGKTLAAASDLKLKGEQKPLERAALVGGELAAKAKQAGVSTVIFDRGSYLYHGRVKALAEAAREGGLKF